MKQEKLLLDIKQEVERSILLMREIYVNQKPVPVNVSLEKEGENYLILKFFIPSLPDEENCFSLAITTTFYALKKHKELYDSKIYIPSQKRYVFRVASATRALLALYVDSQTTGNFDITSL